jgi:transcription antitermination factor NusG
MMSATGACHESDFEAVRGSITPHSASLPWYALRIGSKLRRSISATVCGKGYEIYEPVYRSLRQWSDRAKPVDVPLFPGYLFCRLDIRNRLPILTVPGVIGFVGVGKKPAPVDEEEIETIKAIVASGLAVEPWPFLERGAKVYIERGPLAGVEGIITDTNKGYRLVVSVSLLQRSVSVEIDRIWARPIAPGMGPRASDRGNRKEPHFRRTTGPTGRTESSCDS